MSGARALLWGYAFDCGCLLYQVGATMTLKACSTDCPSREEARELMVSHRTFRAKDPRRRR